MLCVQLEAERTTLRVFDWAEYNSVGCSGYDWAEYNSVGYSGYHTPT